jgi:hypothetical protein
VEEEEEEELKTRTCANCVEEKASGKEKRKKIKHQIYCLL